MKAAIIAAGEGSRLRADGIRIPKPLVKIDGVPLVERLLTTFMRHGITEAVCIVNESMLEVKRFVEEKEFNIPVTFVVKSTPSSMHSLFELSPHLTGGQFLLSTVDSIFREDEFDRFIRHAHARASVAGLLAVTDFIDDDNPLFVEVDHAFRILSFSKAGQVPLATGGLYVFHPKIFREIDSALARGIERLRNFLAHLLDCGYYLEAFPFSKIVDVDRAADLRVAEAFLRAV